MAAGAERTRASISPPVACVAKGGCSYLRALSTIEHLAGFDSTARSYAAAAARCQEEGCWAAARREEPSAQEVQIAAPVSLKTVATTHSREVSASAFGALEPIPFSRARDVIYDGQGNYVEKRALKFDSLPGEGDALAYLYRYWCGLHAETDCRLTNVDTVHLERAGIIGNLHIVDASSSDPGEFCYELLGYAIPVRYSGKPGAYPVTIYAESIVQDYNMARLTAAPQLHRVRSRLAGIGYHYTRLILPFFDSGGRVDRLVVAIRQERGDGLKIETGN